MKEGFIKGSTRPGINEPVIPVTAGTPVIDAICPKSQEALLDRGPFFEAAGWPGVRLWKSAFGKAWSAAEFVALLESVLAKKPFHATGLKSATGNRDYAADLVIDEGTKKLVIFTPEPTKVKGVKCPKSGKLLLDGGGWFEAPGWPGVRLGKMRLEKRSPPRTTSPCSRVGKTAHRSTWRGWSRRSRAKATRRSSCSMKRRGR